LKKEVAGMLKSISQLLPENENRRGRIDKDSIGNSKTMPIEPKGDNKKGGIRLYH